MGTRWKVLVLTQQWSIFNLTPRFYSRETLASVLANYVSGLFLKKGAESPSDTVYVVPLSTKTFSTNPPALWRKNNIQKLLEKVG